MVTSDALKKHKEELKKLYKSNPVNFMNALKQLKEQHGSGRRQNDDQHC